MAPLIILASIRVSAQWEVKSGTGFIASSHIDRSNDFGFNLESTGGNYGYFIENNTNGTNQQAFYFGQSNNNKNVFGISSSSNGGITWESRFVVNQNGNIGIGTNSPEYKLDVKGVIGIDNGYIVLNPTNNSTKKMAIRNSYGGLFIYNDLSNYTYGIFMDEDGNTGLGTSNTSGGKLAIIQKEADDLRSGIQLKNSSQGQSSYFWMDTNNRLHIDNSILGSRNIILNGEGNGNVGIGTDETGSHKLAVEGSIGAREVKVEVGGWSDFVFEESYKLPTLEEVEKHIQEKGHLQDIPSAEQVAKEGIYLGEMGAKLLQKIEELTLYAIEQQKMMQELQNQNKIQSKVIEELKEELNKVKEKL
ncbi:hypothetical protein [Galbibacter sp. PAP.153]|uniref:hypothetical protein n=1 Tax=Galbibacter sp. PAP.153 TaxID=3104623 RepID=UPI003007F3BD